MKAEILSIGSEVALGYIADTNAAWMSQRLTELGYEVIRHTAVGDNREEMLRALESSRGRCAAVLVTGGLGPTLDDMTRFVLADFAGVKLEENAQARETLAAFFQRIGRPMTSSNLTQTLLPQGSEMIPNPRGTAAGFALSVGGTEYIAMPGVPSEMKAMWEAWVGPRLRSRNASATAVRILRVFGIGESMLGEKIADLMARGANPDVGTQVDNSVISVRAVARAASRQEAERMVKDVSDEIRRRLGDMVFGEGEDRLEDAVLRLLEQKGQTLAVAESCTGGLIASRLTDVPGASRFFLEGAVTYSNESKTARLGVPADLIRQHGAVSAPVAEAMARGMRASSGAALALASTGIAGPTGATPQKPIGLVYAALAHDGGVQVEELRLHGTREAIKDRASKHVLNMARLHLLGG
ncbi:MAG TPA: competence/damage-inducible protein A [Candidatus Brocadiia bacterium]|nr:competence/damage-inducible protein A [Candidatus Brocadiia bacterium]